MKDDVTTILSAIDNGDVHQAEQLLPIVYEELRKLAAAKLRNEAPGQTLQPTALVHEAYLRLVDQSKVPEWESSGHFFAAAAESMRRILVDRARRKLRPKHGGDVKRVDLDVTNCATSETNAEQLIAIHEILERFEQEDRVKAELVKLRYFAGMSLKEAAMSLGLPRATASRYWTYSKAWIYSALKG